MNNQAFLLWTVLFSSIGLGFLLYGRKQKSIVPFLCGLALMVYPYFVSGTTPLVLLGVTLTAAPYFIKI